MIGVEGIRATGLYLLETLLHEKSVLYSRFYGADDEIEEQLVRGTKPFLGDEYDEESLREEAHVMLEFAAWQLLDLGIVQIDFLKSELIDGQPDFQIKLTDKGEQVGRDGLKFRFRGPDYAIMANHASKWLITLLGASGGISLTLRQVMDSGASNGEVVVADDYGNEYGLGTSSYTWAFEVSLWHHVKKGVIVSACSSPEHEKAWSEFINRSCLFPAPGPFDEHPLWDVPFRLADLPHGAKLEIQHVGRLSTY